jgi:hypothetical protein
VELAVLEGHFRPISPLWRYFLAAAKIFFATARPLIGPFQKHVLMKGFHPPTALHIVVSDTSTHGNMVFFRWVYRMQQVLRNGFQAAASVCCRR